MVCATKIPAGSLRRFIVDWFLKSIVCALVQQSASCVVAPFLFLVQRGAQWELHQYPKLMAEKGAVPVQIPGYQIRYLPAYVPAGRAIPAPQLGLHFQNNGIVQLHKATNTATQVQSIRTT
jgi:hypothetical protein